MIVEFIGFLLFAPIIGTAPFNFSQFAFAFGFASLDGDFLSLFVHDLVLLPYVLYALLTAAT
eukprot:6460004-Amphidinium_carterae.1